MKATVTLEFTDEELLRHGEDLARRVVVNGIHDLIRLGAVLSPALVQGLASVIAQAQARASSAQPASGPIPPEGTPDFDSADEPPPAPDVPPSPPL